MDLASDDMAASGSAGSADNDGEEAYKPVPSKRRLGGETAQQGKLPPKKRGRPAANKD